MGKEEIARNEQFLLFPQCFFYTFGEVSAMFIKFAIVVCKLFQFGPVQNIVVWERVNIFSLDKDYNGVKVEVAILETRGSMS